MISNKKAGNIYDYITLSSVANQTSQLIRLHKSTPSLIISPSVVESCYIVYQQGAPSIHTYQNTRGSIEFNIKHLWMCFLVWMFRIMQYKKYKLYATHIQSVFQKKLINEILQTLQKQPFTDAVQTMLLKLLKNSLKKTCARA